ncbi:C4-dicarboxylate-binding protein [Vibrio cholerae]|nr:C4-dicarboxylate-binding protein [Vibrio cholerae]
MCWWLSLSRSVLTHRKCRLRKPTAVYRPKSLMDKKILGQTSTDKSTLKYKMAPPKPTTAFWITSW